MIKGRLSILIPLLVMVSMVLTSLLVFFISYADAQRHIVADAKQQLNLDITRLQNILYNSLTGQDKDLEWARLNLSVAAMDNLINTLFLADENGEVVLANRYSMEGSDVSDYGNFDNALAQQVLQQNRPELYQVKGKRTHLFGYYPVILGLEGYTANRSENMGVLFVEYDISDRLAQRRQEKLGQTAAYSGLTLITAMVIAYILNIRVTRRMNQLTLASDSIASGNLQARTQMQGNDELAQLGRSFDDMAQRLQGDIHKREEVEQQLKLLNESLEENIGKRTEELREAQRIAHIGNWIWDEDSGELSWSDEVFRIFGYEENEQFTPTFEHFLSHVHDDDVALLNQAIEEAFASGERYSLDHRITTPAGELKWVHEEGVPRILDHGQRMITGIIQDISERKRDEEELRVAVQKAEQASQAKSHFLSRMSHELRTPMNAILGFSQVLESEVEDQEHADYIHEILAAGNHLHDLINDLLDVSLIEAGRLALVMESVNIRTVVAEALNIVTPMAREKKVVIDNQCDRDIYVVSDVLRLRQVLVNIITNAVKYNSAEGRVTIHCEPQADERLNLTIEDTGPGMDEEQLQRAFEPFERLGSEYSQEVGTGLGLFLTRQLVNVIKAEMSLHSQPGEGTAVHLELILADSSERQLPVSELKLSNTQPGKCSVLYIEDNPANYRVMNAMLKRLDGVQLIPASDGEMGMELVQRFHPDLILLDIHLPGIDGYEVLRRLKADSRTREIPVVALTADAMPLDVEKGLAAGFSLYLTKPVRLEELVETIRNLTRSGPISLRQ